MFFTIRCNKKLFPCESEKSTEETQRDYVLFSPVEVYVSCTILILKRMKEDTRRDTLFVLLPTLRDREEDVMSLGIPLRISCIKILFFFALFPIMAFIYCERMYGVSYLAVRDIKRLFFAGFFGFVLAYIKDQKEGKTD